MIAMAGLFLTGIDQFTGIALGTIAVVGIAVAGSLTVLPALLSWFGRRADWGRIPFLGRSRAAARPSRLWAALVRRVVAHPAIWGVTAAVALLALAAPALGMRLGEPAVDVPPGQAVAQTTNAIQRAFPQAPSPAEVVVTGPGATGPRVLAAVAALQGRAATGGPIHEPVTATVVGGPAGGPAGGGGEGPGHRHPAGRPRIGFGVGSGPGDPAPPDPARHAGPRARDQVRRNRRHGQRV